ncbi:MAG: DNA methyltransferase [Rhodospirillaceae bacterium]
MTAFTDLAIEPRMIADLMPYARNARKHPEKQIAQIAASIREFGFNNPVLVDADGGIIAGHGRVLAARKLGLLEVPTIRIDHLTEAERRAFILADNRIALSAGWDDEILALEMADLSNLGLEVSLTGFTDAEINRLLADATPEDPREDETPEVEEMGVSLPGDLWLLGDHRVACGDATDAALVNRLLDGALPTLMVTDPPYGVEYDAEWRDKVHGSEGSVRSTGAVSNDDRFDWTDALRHFPGNVAYVWHAASKAVEVAEGLAALGFERRAQIVWVKQHFAISRGHYHWQHEPCWYAVRKGRTGNWLGDRKQSTVWEVPNASAFGGADDDGKTIHSTQKPVEVMRRPILNHTKPGEPVYDPFLGSGTTVIAAHHSGRIALGLELEPRYVDVIVRRWQSFAGAEAVLDGTDRTFEEISAERLAGEPS